MNFLKMITFTLIIFSSMSHSNDERYAVWSYKYERVDMIGVRDSYGIDYRGSDVGIRAKKINGEDNTYINITKEKEMLIKGSNCLILIEKDRKIKILKKPVKNSWKYNSKRIAANYIREFALSGQKDLYTVAKDFAEACTK